MIAATLKIDRLRLVRRPDGVLEHELNPAPGSVPTELSYTFACGDPAVGDRILDVLLVGYGPARVTGRAWLRGHLVVACTAIELPPPGVPS